MSKAYFVLATAFVWEHSLATQQPTEGIAYWFVVYFTFRQGIQISIIFTSAERRKLCSKGNVYVFIPICWLVCLLAILRENAWTDFNESCRIDPTWYKENNLETFGDVRFNPLHTWFLFLFSGKSVLLVTLRKNGKMDFHDISRTGRIWVKELSGWIFLFYFLGPYFLATLQKNR